MRIVLCSIAGNVVGRYEFVVVDVELAVVVEDGVDVLIRVKGWERVEAHCGLRNGEQPASLHLRRYVLLHIILVISTIEIPIS